MSEELELLNDRLREALQHKYMLDNLPNAYRDRKYEHHVEQNAEYIRAIKRTYYRVAKYEGTHLYLVK